MYISEHFGGEISQEAKRKAEMEIQHIKNDL
jgi:hypothetical protein